MSDDNIVEFPPPPQSPLSPPEPQPQPPDLLIGPFEEWRVIVEGRIIPKLTGYHDGDKIGLVLDHRFSASFAPDDARQAAWLIANALAIGEGYSHLGALTKEQPFAPIGAQISAAPAPASPPTPSPVDPKT
jgi:hypothetical protein